jgi:hypothetical protein
MEEGGKCAKNTTKLSLTFATPMPLTWSPHTFSVQTGNVLKWFQNSLKYDIMQSTSIWVPIPSFWLRAEMGTPAGHKTRFQVLQNSRKILFNQSIVYKHKWLFCQFYLFQRLNPPILPFRHTCGPCNSHPGSLMPRRQYGCFSRLIKPCAIATCLYMHLRMMLCGGRSSGPNVSTSCL